MAKLSSTQIYGDLIVDGEIKNKATTTTEGVVQLSDAIDNTSTTQGATANAVKTVNDSLSAHKTDTTSHITASERTTWNSKASTSTVSTSANGLMSSIDKTKLDGIAVGANNYTHPTTHPTSMITGLSVVATSGSYNDLTNKPSTFTPSTHTHDDRYYTESEVNDLLGVKAPISHTHTKSQITDFPIIPTSLPANGGNADTVDGLHANQLGTLDSVGSSHGTSFPLMCQYNRDLDGQFKLYVEGHQTKVDQSNNTDTVDGLHASSFARTDIATTFYNSVTVNYPQSLNVRHIEGANSQELFLNYLSGKQVYMTTPETGMINLGYEISSLKSSVSNGKQEIATAITGKGISATGSDSFSSLATKVGQITSKSLNLRDTFYKLYHLFMFSNPYVYSSEVVYTASATTFSTSSIPTNEYIYVYTHKETRVVYRGSPTLPSELPAEYEYELIAPVSTYFITFRIKNLSSSYVVNASTIGNQKFIAVSELFLIANIKLS